MKKSVNYINKKQIGLLLFVLTQTIFMLNTQAEIFKCTNLKGAVYYNDKPCPINNKEQKIKAQKDVVNGYAPTKRKVSVGSQNFNNEVSEKIAERASNNRFKEYKSEKANTDKKKASANSKSKGNKKAKKQNSQAKGSRKQKSTVSTGMRNNSETKSYQNDLTAVEQERLFVDMHAGESIEEGR